MQPNAPPAGRLYHEFADLWRLMSPPEDYAAEAAHWRFLLRKHLGPGRHALLDLGVGGGHHLSHLAREFAVTGIDLSPDMLAQCRRLLPNAELHPGDMRSLRLGRTFDAVLAHDAIGHMLTEADLLAAFRTAADHLRPGGLFLSSPERFLGEFHSPEVETATHSDGVTTFSYFQYDCLLHPESTVVDTFLTYVIQTADGVRIEHDRMQTGLFSRATWLRLLQETGFSVESRAFPLPGWPRPYEILVGIRSA